DPGRLGPSRSMEHRFCPASAVRGDPRSRALRLTALSAAMVNHHYRRLAPWRGAAASRPVGPPEAKPPGPLPSVVYEDTPRRELQRGARYFFRSRRAGADGVMR